MTIRQTAQTGDRLKTLEALRDKLARDLDDAPPAVVAQIAGQFRAVLKDIAEISTGSERSALDDLQQQRARRLAGAELAPPAERRAR